MVTVIMHFIIMSYCCGAVLSFPVIFIKEKKLNNLDQGFLPYWNVAGKAAMVWPYWILSALFNNNYDRKKASYYLCVVWAVFGFASVMNFVATRTIYPLLYLPLGAFAFYMEYGNYKGY